MPAAKNSLDSNGHLPNEIPENPTEASIVGTPYQRILHSIHHDQKWISEVSLGKRVGFYRFKGDLGSGNFSQVKMAIHELTKERVAVKILDKGKLDQKTRKMLAREIATMEAIHHPNIIRLYEVVESYSKIFLIMEYAGGGELFNKITTVGRISEIDAKSLYGQVVSAVKYMHDHNFIHRDIKAENVFFSSPGLVKLGDFGFSTQLKLGCDEQLNTFCGSPPYAAPELFRDESYVGAPVDIWALGVLLYFTVTGQMPFKAQTVATLKKHILEGVYHVPSHLSSSCRKLIDGILKQDPSDRLTISEIRDSDWLKGVHVPTTPCFSEQYSLTPSQINPTNGKSANDIEITARERLGDLGITADLLNEHRERGARSAVIGTYRIVVHRLQRLLSLSFELDALTIEEVGSSQNSAAHSAANSAGKFSLAAAFGRRTKSAAVKPEGIRSKSKNGRSKTCVII